ncbi:MAG: TetR/AcrR family transcriptional regulator [Hyphomicrobiales bacterium]
MNRTKQHDDTPVECGTRMVKKRRQILNGAREVFLKEGFEGASVDDISNAANVSKATLYNHFPDKRLMFKAVIEEECDKQAGHMFALPQNPEGVEATLLEAAQGFVNFLTTPFAHNIFRICVGEADRFPELGHDFYRTGPALLQDHLVKFFEDCEPHNVLSIEDPVMAADQFAELCKAGLFARAVFGVQTKFTKKEKEKVAREAIATFMARYSKQAEV